MSQPLKSISQDAIPRALKKAERYRLLNEPVGAESICLDILKTDPGNQQALVTLLLAKTDQFGHGYRLSEIDPEKLVEQLRDPYERAYYAGLVAERHAQAVLGQNVPQSSYIAHDLLSEAMKHYERAEQLRPAGNDDALLRWNTCARMMNSRGVKARAEEIDDRLE